MVKLIQDFIIILVTCKNKDLIENIGPRVLTTLLFFRRPKAGNSIVSRLTWFKFDLIQVFMHVLVSCTNEEDPIKNNGARVLTTFYKL